MLKAGSDAVIAADYTAQNASVKNRSMLLLAQHWPLVAGLIFLWMYLLANLLMVLRVNDGHLIYALDDPYIHMAIARNVIEHHVWGVTPYGFAWCSSSPLWTSLISGAYYLFGVSNVTPLVLAIASATACCAVAYLVLRSTVLSARQIFAVLLIFVLVPSLPPLVFMGEEHVLHIALTIAFTYLASCAIARDADELDWPLIIVTPFVAIVRYEGAFLLAGAALLLFVRGRIRSAAIVSVLGLAPVAVFGSWAMAHGWGFFPNSVLLKGNVPSTLSLNAVLGFCGAAFENLRAAPWLDALGLAAAAMLFLMVRAQRIWGWRSIALLLYIFIIGCQVTLARTGSSAYYRYDAFLLATGIVFIATASREREVTAFLHNHQRIALFGLALVIATLLPRAIHSLAVLTNTTHNIYEQQHQMARFVKRFYSHQTVALNDIGAVTYASDVHVLDLVGLASRDVAADRRSGNYNEYSLERITDSDHAAIAIVYAGWLSSLIGKAAPPNWTKVAEWTIHDASIDLPTLTFYAIGSSEVPQLHADLEAFTPELPKGITVTFDANAARAISP